MAHGNEMAMCTACGHARMSHSSGRCSICGCGERTSETRTGILGPGTASRGRPATKMRAADPQRSRPSRIWYPGKPAPDPKPQPLPLTRFVIDHLTQDEAREFGKAVAERYGQSFDESAPRAVMDSLVRAIPPSAASRYLVELRVRSVWRSMSAARWSKNPPTAGRADRNHHRPRQQQIDESLLVAFEPSPALTNLRASAHRQERPSS